MSVYFIVDITVHDQETYASYIAQARPLIKSHGGTYRVIGGAPRNFAGDWVPSRIVMIEFESMAAFEACFESEEYKRIAPLRERSADTRAVVVNGCDVESALSNV